MKSQTTSIKFRQLYFSLILHAILCSFLPRLCYGGKAYPGGCANKLLSYYDYDETYSWPPPADLCRTSEEFWLLRRLGNGKFSDVFEALEKKDSIERQPNAKNEKGSNYRLVVIKVCVTIKKCNVSNHSLTSKSEQPIIFDNNDLCQINSVS